MRIRKMFLLAGSIIITLIVLAVAWLLTTSKSVLWSYSESGEISPIPTFAILNPFREKKTETESYKILESIKGGHCNAIVLELGVNDRYRSLCANFMDDPLEDWKLVFREDKGNTVTLFYQTKSASEHKFDDSIGVTLQKEDDKWRLTDIGSIY